MNEHQRQDKLQRRLGQVECPADHAIIFGLVDCCDLCKAVL